MKPKLLFALALFTTTVLWGAYRDTRMKQWKQPNGIEFTARLWGDEFENQMETNDGYRIAKGADGYFYYAILDSRGEFSSSNNKVGIDSKLPSSYKLQRSAARIRELQEAFRKAQESYRSKRRNTNGRGGNGLGKSQTTNVKLAVVLIDFTPSAKYTGPAPNQNGYLKHYFDEMFFSTNYWIGTENQNGDDIHPEGDEVFGSFRDYYKNQSVNQIDIVGKDNNAIIINPVVSGTERPQWVTLPNKKSWYENTQNIVHSTLVENMRQATITQLGIDVAQYDAVCFVYAGEVGHGALAPATTSIYSTGGERENDKFSHIGTEVHEFGHAYLGACDEYNSIYNPKWWSIMGYGNYNGPNLNSECPAPFSPLYRIEFGWITPIEITSNAQNLNIVYNQTSPNFYRIKIPASNDYFVVERRQKDNFDKYTPEYETGNGPNGILIWHAAPDYITPVYSNFERILYAHNDDWTTPYADHRFPYPQDSSQTISDATSPSIKKRSGSNSYITISNIEWLSGHGEIDVTIYDNYTQNTTISSSTTLSRHQKVNSGVNLTVANGATVTIPEGITFAMGSGSNVTSNGKIIANGTASNKVQFFPISGSTSGSFGSLIFDGSGSTNSVLTNVSFVYGTEIRANNAPNITIQNSTISNSINGINFVGSTTSGSILSNAIVTPRDHGIIVQSSSDAACNNNTITKTDHSGAGILFSGGGSGTIYQNDVEGFNWGIGSIWGSYVDFTGNVYITVKNNLIKNCLYGIYAYQQGYALITPQSGGITNYFKWNSIHSNTYKNVYYTSGGTIYARMTYWGGTPNSNMWTLGSGCSIDYSDWLTSDPWNVSLSLPKSASQGTGTELSGLSELLTTEKDGLFLQGIEQRLRKNYKQAKEIFISHLSKHPEDQEAYVQLYNSFNGETASDIVNFFESLPVNAAKEHKLLLSYLYLKQGSVELAKKCNEQLAKEYPNTELAVRAKLNNFYISLYNESDPKGASAILSGVQTQKELTTDIELSLAEHALATYVEGEGSNNNKPFEKTIEVASTDFDLSQNYPNPFNPSTAFSYQIPNDIYVTFKVFDILGKEVATLVNEQKSAGRYTVTLNGSHLSSGTYIARINAGSLTKTMKVILLK